MSEFFRGDTAGAFEETGEVIGFGKAEAPGDLIDGPVGTLQQDPGFLQYPCIDQLRSGLPGGFFKGLVEMVDVNIELFGKSCWAVQLDHLVTELDGELPFQQFGKNAGDPLRCIGAMHGRAGSGLHLLCFMDEFHQEIAEQIVFVRVVALQFLEHPCKTRSILFTLFRVQWDHCGIRVLEDRKVFDVAGFIEKVFCEDAHVTGMFLTDPFPVIGDHGIGEYQYAAFHSDHLVSVMDLTVARDQTDFEKVPAAVGDGLVIRQEKVLHSEDVEVACFLNRNVFLVEQLVEGLKSYEFRHGAKVQKSNGSLA